MANDILLVTTPTSFGELIQQTLQETGRFRVVFTSSGKEAIQCAHGYKFVLGIFDVEVKDTPISDLVGFFKDANPHMRFIVIPPDNRPGTPEVSGLPIRDFLMKPFYLPDLLETVDRVLNAGLPEKHAQPLEKVEDNLTGSMKPAHIPAWLQDEGKTSQLLTSLSLETAAQGILIVRGEQLWAYAGQLNQPAAQEAARVVANYWSVSASGLPCKKSDLARFVHLGSTGGEYMLFATPLRGEMVLGLIFEAETPFNQIRSQTYQMARALASPEGVIRQQRGGATVRTTEPPTVPLPRYQPAHKQGSGEWDENATRVPFKPLLDNIPPPMPGLSVTKPAGKKEIVQGFVDEHLLEQPELADVKETKIKSVEPIIAETGQQSALPVVFDLSYFCLVIPRMPQHQMNGDLAVKLSEWVGQLCMAYGWRLEHLSIQPDFMQWVVNVVPTVAPDYLMETLRKQTSERIFAGFPELGKDNPSGDFWAPGYLILTRIEQLSDQMIQDFIHRVRQYQGASPTNSYRMRR